VKSILRTYDWLITALAVLAGAVVAIIFVLIVLDVAWRELAGGSFAFTLGVVEYGLLYFTLLAAPYLVRQKGHVFIEAMVVRFPRGLRRALEIIVYLLCIAATLVFAYFSLVLLMEKIQSGTLDIRGIDFPSWVIVAPLAPCYLLVALEFLRFLIGPDSMYESDSSKNSF
jgi:C4-dicarboxylate transporter DctQ subunit